MTQLRERGVPPRTSRSSSSSLHEDHASAIEAFPEALFIVSATEWEAATIRFPRLHGYHRSHYDFAFEYNTIDFDGDFIESYVWTLRQDLRPVRRRLSRARLHAGPQRRPPSVILRLRRRDFVVIGDAAYDWRQFNGQAEPTLWEDEHNWRRSLRELHSAAPTPYALMVPDMTGRFWKKLEPRYEE